MLGVIINHVDKDRKVAHRHRREHYQNRKENLNSKEGNDIKESNKKFTY